MKFDFVLCHYNSFIINSFKISIFEVVKRIFKSSSQLFMFSYTNKREKKRLRKKTINSDLGTTFALDFLPGIGHGPVVETANKSEKFQIGSALEDF